jgi:(E)-4-hydroxy-3-methylbut-2-enyl-diphosphate synthase
MASLCDYPLHVGITATGLPLDGIVKSGVGIGVLLFKGIGDTIRVSLLQEPRQEVKVAASLLNSLELREFGPELICCPTCGRCQVDLLKKAKNFEARLGSLSFSEKARLKDHKIALMGCVVNGPGEARQADLGIAFSKHKGILFKKGKVLRTVELRRGEEELFSVLKSMLRRGGKI